MTSTPGLAGTLLAYTVARLLLVAAVAGLLVLAGVPLLLAVLIGVIAALPLSALLLRGPRKRVDAALAVARARRAEQREVLRARLRGDDLPGDDLLGGDPPSGDPPSGDPPSDDLPGGDPPRDDLPDPAEARSGEVGERQPDAGEHRPGQQ